MEVVASAHAVVSPDASAQNNKLPFWSRYEMQLIPVELFVEVRNVREKDLRTMMERGVRREILKRCIDILEGENRTERATELLESISNIKDSFLQACREADIVPPQAEAEEIEEQVTLLSFQIRETGFNELTDKLMCLQFRTMLIDDEMWIDTGIAINNSDHDRYHELSIEKLQEIDDASNDIKQMMNHAEVSKMWKDTLGYCLKTTMETYEFLY